MVGTGRGSRGKVAESGPGRIRQRGMRPLWRGSCFLWPPESPAATAGTSDLAPGLAGTVDAS